MWNAEPRTASSRITALREWRQRVKPAILERDGYRCQIRYLNRCLGRATTVDKIIPAASRPDLAFDEANLRAACEPCNDHKARTVDQPKRSTRPAERHPGLL